MKKAIYITLLIMVSGAAMAQPPYRNELGLRFGAGTAIDYRHFTNDNTSLEAMLAFRWRGFIITGLYEKNFPVIKETPGFNLYIGGGAHIGFWDRYHSHPWFDDHVRRSYTAIGVDGIIGFEYTFKEVPINLAVDWKPMINIIDYASFWAGDAGFSIRYAF